MHRPHRTKLTARNLRRPADLHQRPSPTFLRLDGMQEVSILGVTEGELSSGQKSV